jgi:MoaA/NifB/PqqE/SkfB family radical SAM enzyme
MVMLSEFVRENRKKALYLASFARRRLVHVNMQLLYDCTFTCDICDFWKPEYKNAPRLTADQVAVLSDKLAEVGPQVVSLGGGEPLMHEDLPGVIRALAKHHFPVMICNGWFMTPDKARAMWAAGAYEVSISVDYADAERHDAQRGRKGAWQRAVDALRMLHDNRVRPWQRVHMISVVMDDNIDDIERLIHMCREMGITYLVTLYSSNRGAKENRQVPLDVSQHLLDLKAKYPEFVVVRGYVSRFSEAIRDGGIGSCLTGRCLCNIDSTGQVSLCIDRVSETLGNLLTDSMATIERQLLAAYKANTCQDCWTSCRGNIETLMSGRDTLHNMYDYWQLTRTVPLGGAYSA